MLVANRLDPVGVSRGRRGRLLRALLPALAGVGVSTAALAQGVTHAPAVYTTRDMGQLAAGADRARSVLPLVDPSVVPRELLLRGNAPEGGDADVKPGATRGSSDGRTAPDVAPDAYGNYSPLSIAPYTAAGAYATVLGRAPASAAQVAVTSYPWRATGKLTFRVGAGAAVCSASLIKPGLLLTAAHCVFSYGANNRSGYYTNFVFEPSRTDAARPYGAFTAVDVFIPNVYFQGTDTCLPNARGVVCNNDIAILAMAPLNGQLPGNVVGTYAYGWNGYSYVRSFGGAQLSQLTQLGYPVAFDGGLKMERNNGIGAYWAPVANLKNTLQGSALTGGSSGGPWLVNFGARPSVNAAQASLGNANNSNVVVGVTSWGYTQVGSNTQGASWFGQNLQFPNASYTDHGINRGAGNIGALVAAACTLYFSRC